MRAEREVRQFSVDYDDESDKLNIHVTTVTEVISGRGREWQQGDRRHERNVMSLTRGEFESLMSQGLQALTYQIGLVREHGVRVDYRTETLKGSA
jgi:hypothetical protein